MILLLTVMAISLIGALAYGYYRGYMDAYDKGMDDMEKIAEENMNKMAYELRDYYEEQIRKTKQQHY